MKVICYFDMNDAQGERLERIIELFLSREKILLYRSMDALRDRLRQPYNYDNVVLVSLASREGLSEFVSLRDLLRDMRIIMVLPDREHDTVALGHLLRPRMISYSDGDFLDVAAVLVRMMEKQEMRLS